MKTYRSKDSKSSKYSIEPFNTMCNSFKCFHHYTKSSLPELSSTNTILTMPNKGIVNLAEENSLLRSEINTLKKEKDKLSNLFNKLKTEVKLPNK